MPDVYQTKQSVSVLVVSGGFLFLNIDEFHNKSWQVEHTQEQFIIFLGFIDVLSHPMRIGVMNHSQDR